VGLGSEGGIVLCCHAGCRAKTVLDAADLSWQDIMPEHRTENQARVREWEIRETDGTLRAIHRRYDDANGKSYSWYRPDGLSGLNGVRTADLPLYGADKIHDFPLDQPIVVTEGESACDALSRRGISALATVTGANGTPSEQPLTVLLGRPAILWADADTVGEAHMERIAARLLALGHKDVRRVLWRDAPLHGDAADFEGDVSTVLEAASPYTRHRSDRSGSSPAALKDDHPPTEVGDAEFFAGFIAGRALFDHLRQQWFLFETHHWRPDNTKQIVQTAIAAMRQRQAIALALPASEERTRRLKHALAGEAEGRIRHLLELASTHHQLAIEGTEWDRDGSLLGVANGVVDLRTGILRDGTPQDHITRIAAAAYDPAAACPTWNRFILEVCNEQLDLAAFLHRSIGYSLTGETSEQCFWLFYGLGSNGKSTLLETLTQHVIPQHAWTMAFPVATWAESMSEYQRAELVGRRIVVAKESEQAKRLNTEFIKSLTGGDTVNARHPYGRPFTFVPAAKFYLACNHKPIIRDESLGMWRRVRLVPFVRTFVVDPTFADKLATEAAGILGWCVRGCLAWQRQGLKAPAIVTDATAEYERDSDTLASFIEACCIVAPGVTVRAGVLFDAYTRWCEDQRLAEADRLNRRTFGERLKRTFQAIESRHVTYTGLGLRREDEE
jgi:putative DNA primase/helicase